MVPLAWVIASLVKAALEAYWLLSLLGAKTSEELLFLHICLQRHTRLLKWSFFSFSNEIVDAILLSSLVHPKHHKWQHQCNWRDGNGKKIGLRKIQMYQPAFVTQSISKPSSILLHAVFQRTVVISHFWQGMDFYFFTNLIARHYYHVSVICLSDKRKQFKFSGVSKLHRQWKYRAKMLHEFLLWRISRKLI